MSANKTFTYKDLEAVIDMTDYRTVEKWEAALEQFKKSSELALQKKKTSEQLKSVFGAYADMLDMICGEGATKKALGESQSVDEAVAVFTALRDFANQQEQGNAARYKSLSSQYSPKGRTRAKAAK